VVQATRSLARGLAARFSVDGPVGPLLLVIGLATFLLPNTYEIFRRFDPALGLPKEKKQQGALRGLNWRVAFALAGMFVLSVLGLSHVSPFLYFQF
jgi:hypothetical protein